MPQDEELSVRQLSRRLAADLNSKLEAELLLGDAIGRERAWLYAHSDYPLSKAEIQRLKKTSDQRKVGVPIAYVLGTREFYGREFIVNPSVLIPRPETELLIERALALPLPKRPRILDIGTGSGCIILTLAAERPQWQCMAVDISSSALTVAKQNQKKLELPDNAVNWLHGHLFEPLLQPLEPFNLIISNPPYVAIGDPHLERGDLRFEPDVALASGEDGLDLIREIIEHAPSFLTPEGWLMIEHGYNQSKAVCEQLMTRGFAEVTAINDLAGINRVVQAQWQSINPVQPPPA